MAFLSARCTRYENRSAPDGTPTGIYAAGFIEDDALTEQRYHEYWIVGDEFTNLPAVNPLTDGTPADLRFQAIQAILTREVKVAYDAWMVEIAQRAQVQSKTEAELAMLPMVTPAELAALTSQTVQADAVLTT